MMKIKMILLGWEIKMKEKIYLFVVRMMLRLKVLENKY